MSFSMATFGQTTDQDTTEIDGMSRVVDTKAFTLIKYGTIGAYTVGAFSLYEFWYKDFEQESFHFFNDYGEWSNVDKFGHMHATYFQANLIYKGYKWSGVSDNKAILWSSLSSLGFQTAIEVMDGFSSGWGFSISDYTANLLGLSTFALQQRFWKEQKFQFKMSYWPESYSLTPILTSSSLSINDRANQLFGSSFSEQFLKDYNSQTYWLSFHPTLLFPELKTPKWLNVSLGYGAENMFGGFENTWVQDNQSIDITDITRTRQYIVALDYDLSKIHTKSKFLKTILDVLNSFKWPSPGIEFTSEGEIKFHLLFLN